MSNEINIGGSVNGAVANGPKARAVQRDVSINQGTTGGDDLLAALATLRTLVEQNADRIPDAAKVRKDVGSIGAEVESSDGDTSAMRDAVVRIISRVGMVGTVLEAAKNLRELIEPLIHGR